ncbi:MAG: hypothetical protein Kow00129_12410 [Thermoleophilia bacterium]
MKTTARTLAEVLIGLRPGENIVHPQLTLVPLMVNPDVDRSLEPYLLLEEALEAGCLEISEVNDIGEVSALRAVNRCPIPVLLYDGEELVGAKQNRILNTTVLLGQGETLLPVSCVEAGRWNMRSPAFRAGSGPAHPELRALKTRHVTANVRRRQQARPTEPTFDFRSDQSRVWSEVAERSVRLGSHSPTSAMADVYRDREQEVAAVVEEVGAALRRRAAQAADGPWGVGWGIIGLVAILNNRFACADLLLPSERFGVISPKLLRGYALQALDPTAGIGRPPVEDAEEFTLRLLAALKEAQTEIGPGVGLGEDLRFDAPGFNGAGVVWQGGLLQLSVFPEG